MSGTLFPKESRPRILSNNFFSNILLGKLCGDPSSINSHSVCLLLELVIVSRCRFKEILLFTNDPLILIADNAFVDNACIYFNPLDFGSEIKLATSNADIVLPCLFGTTTVFLTQ